MSYSESPSFSVYATNGRLKGLKNVEDFRKYVGSETHEGSRHWLFLLNEQVHAEAHNVFIGELGLPDLSLGINDDEIIEEIEIPNSPGLTLIRQEMRLRKGEELGHAVCFFAQPEILAS